MIHRVWVSGFRNLQEQLVDLAPLTRISGLNNHGKTNFLDAIHFGLTGKTVRSTSSDEVVSLGGMLAKVGMSLSLAGQTASFYRMVLPHQKPTLEWSDRSAIVDLSSFGCAYWSDELIRLFQESPDARRVAIDRFSSILNPGYAKVLTQYRLALKRRNEALKAKNITFIESITSHFISLAESVVTIRVSVCDWVSHALTQWASSVEGFPLTRWSFVYSPKRVTLDGYAAHLRRLLSDRLSLEMAIGYTTHGPHCDDVSVIDTLSSSPLLTHFSRGINRCVAIACESLLWELKGGGGVALLDDSFSELAIDLRRSMLSKVCPLFSQVLFVSTLSEDHQLIPFDTTLTVHQGGVCALTS